MVMLTNEERQDIRDACEESADGWRQRRAVCLRVNDKTGADKATLAAQRLDRLADSFGRFAAGTLEPVD